MRKLLLALMLCGGLLLVVLSSPPEADSTRPEVDVAIVMAVDCSWSVSPDEFNQQMQGIAAAFRSKDVIDTILSGYNGRIAVAMLQWADPTHQHLFVPWTLIASPKDAERVAAAVGKTARTIHGDITSISAAVTTGMVLHQSSPYPSLRRVIDVSGDGVNNSGELPQVARDLAIARGITVNGLAILNEVPYLRHYYRRFVVSGPGSFAEVAKDYVDFRAAIKCKLLREIRPPPSA